MWVCREAKGEEGVVDPGFIGGRGGGARSGAQTGVLRGRRCGQPHDFDATRRRAGGGLAAQEWWILTGASASTGMMSRSKAVY